MTDPEAELLKVAPGASLAEVKRAFRKAALAHHPDQNPDPQAARHFRRLTEAYRILEARAQAREPARPPRELPPADRIGFVVADLRVLVRRWPEERWSGLVDGLPPAVWAASILEVLARAWPAAAPFPPVDPTAPGIAAALEAWPLWTETHPFPSDPGKKAVREAREAVRAAEARLRALAAPSRTPPRGRKRAGPTA